MDADLLKAFDLEIGFECWILDVELPFLRFERQGMDMSSLFCALLSIRPSVPKRTNTYGVCVLEFGAFRRLIAPAILLVVSP